MLKDDSITFEQAEILLAKIADGKYHSLKYGRTNYCGEYGSNIVAECGVYIDGYDHCSGPTWYEAFHKLALEMDPPAVTDEEQPTGVA